MGVMGWRGHPYFGQGVVRPPLGQKEKKKWQDWFCLWGWPNHPQGPWGWFGHSKGKTKKIKLGGFGH